MFLFRIVIRKGDGMRSKLKRFISLAVLIGIIFTLFNFQTVYAENNSPDTIGMVKSSIPYIQVELKENDLSTDDISAKLGSEAISLYDLTPVSQQKSLTVIAFDNSKSMTQNNICPNGSFEQMKKDASSLVQDNVDEYSQFCLYSIGKGNPKNLGLASDSDSASDLTEKIGTLKGNEDATNLNESLGVIFDELEDKQSEYGLIKILLITDTSADYGMGIDMSEIDSKFQYNKIPLYTICNTVSENSEAYKSLRSISRNSGGEAAVYNYKSDYSLVFSNIFKEMNKGCVASFVCNTPADSKARELNVSVNGKVNSETILLDTALNIEAPVNADVVYDKDSNSFNISFHQEGFEGNIPVNTAALQNNSYLITKSGKKKNLPVQKVERNTDGSYRVTMKKDIYSGTYDFEFDGICDLSSKENTVQPFNNVEIKAKSSFWIVFPYLVAVLSVALVLLAFYLILLNLKKKKNVKTIRELFVTQVNETVEEHKHIVNVVPPANLKYINFYFKTGNAPAVKYTKVLQSSIIVGRNGNCDIVVNDAKMSNQHFAVELVQNQVMIRDLDSKNGTYVDGVNVLSRQKLKSGSLILAGLTSIRIEF